MEIEPIALAAAPEVLKALPRLAAALEGGAPVHPYAAHAPLPPLPTHDPADLPADLAVVIGTSGSTGTPKRAMLSTQALRASIDATADRIGAAHAQWLLAVPPHHIAGLQVLLRSVAAGTTPVVTDQREGFTPDGFVAAAARLEPGVRHLVSLVPTQVTRLLDDRAATESLAGFTAVLTGGAVIPPLLVRRAAAAGVRLVRTYGMSETAGGCVYDGYPLAGVHVRVVDARVHLGGPVLADGYLGRPDLTEKAFLTEADAFEAVGCWFRTDDLGHLDAKGVLHIDGRVDDVIVTGGVKVAPRLVEQAIVEHVEGAVDAVVVGVPDREWGEVVAALVVLGPHSVHRALVLSDLRGALRGVVHDHALPRRVHAIRDVQEIPMRGPGKPDRRAIGDLFRD